MVKILILPSTSTYKYSEVSLHDRSVHTSQSGITSYVYAGTREIQFRVDIASDIVLIVARYGSLARCDSPPTICFNPSPKTIVS